MKSDQGNLFAEIPAVLPKERFEELLTGKSFRVERIVSSGHATAPSQWYDQETREWVVLLSGSAGVLMEGEKAARQLRQGDYLDIPAHQRHRVEWTDPKEKTVWLAIHYRE